MIDIQAIAAELRRLQEDFIRPDSDPMREFDGQPVNYKPDGTAATIRGTSGNVLVILPDGSTLMREGTRTR